MGRSALLILDLFFYLFPFMEAEVEVKNHSRGTASQTNTPPVTTVGDKRPKDQVTNWERLAALILNTNRRVQAMRVGA